MYIKQIIIQGFKSYKDQTVIEPFSPKTNIIVGRNGSGKSNFFAAIRFVLSDAYTQMGREERQALLHEGSGSAVMSAYVEIIFDNSDDRFPTGRPELILRRTIGLKKDEYSLDRRNATKADVMNLLESAGFSRSNPYYIVPQGRVTALTNMKDSERLKLLKEVAGTHVYESRREESLKIMQDTDAKQVKIDELLSYIRERLNELEEEKDELRAYQDKDRERRCLEYTIYHHEQEELNSALAELDNRRERGVDETDEDRQRLLAGEAQIEELDAQALQLSQRVDLIRTEKKQLESEQTALVREHAQAELAVAELSAGHEAAMEAFERRAAEIEAIQQQLAAREAELERVAPEYTSARELEDTRRAELEEAQRQRQQLYAKQTRTSQFRSKSERDRYLAREIAQCEQVLQTRESIRATSQREIGDIEVALANVDKSITERKARFENRGPELESLAQHAQEAKEASDAVMDERKELWRKQVKLDNEQKQVELEVERAERQLNNMMDQATSRGLAAIKRLQRQHNIAGIFGPLAELFTVPEAYKTAVEVTAGTSLFHVVVDNDDTATKLLEHLTRDRLGRVTFMPLNRLRARNTVLPNAADAVPLKSKLEYSPDVELAFDHVFGRTIVCPSLQVAAQYARTHMITAITPWGDRSDKKGALTGGYHDPRFSRLDSIRALAAARSELEQKREASQEVKRALEQIEQRVTRAISDVQRAEQRRQQHEASLGPLRKELQDDYRDQQMLLDDRANRERANANHDSAIRLLQQQIEGHRAEMRADFRSGLTEAETAELEQLGPRIQALQQAVLAAGTTRTTLEGRKAELEAEVRQNLRPRLDQLQAAQESGSGTATTEIRSAQDTVARLARALADSRARVSEAEAAADKASSDLAAVRQRRTDAQRQLEEIAAAIDRHQRRLEKSMAKKAILTEKAAECARNIRDLGVLPDEAFDRYARMNSDAAIKRLHRVNEALKKYAHVNKKAFEQYANFTRQRDTLLDRRKELDDSQGSIQQLINVLDRRKDEAIERTFKQVSREFANVFERLVPAGMGRLVIQRRADRAGGAGQERAGGEEEEESDEDEQAAQSVESYVGVGISVSFNSKHDDQQRIQQLSGGQKSLCALALVFAIQQSDPAPFYLFDEIDANLDAQYRTAVAAMLKDLSEGRTTRAGGSGAASSTSNGTAAAAAAGSDSVSSQGPNGAGGTGGQFICTTFRPEMVHVAEKCYGVSYSNKTSSIDVVDREAALAFVEGQKQ